MCHEQTSELNTSKSGSKGFEQKAERIGNRRKEKFQLNAERQEKEKIKRTCEKNALVQ